MFDMSVVLLQNAFETTSSFTDVWRLRDFPPHLTAYSFSNKHKVSCCSGRPCTASIFQSFDTTAVIDFIQ